MKKIFISYKRKDLELVGKLIQQLEPYKFEIWWDQQSIQAGKIWKSEVKNGIKDVDFFFACFSNSYDNSDSEMNEELFQAIEKYRKFPQNTQFLIPIKLTPCKIPDFDLMGNKTLNDLQYIDLSNNWSKGFNELISSILNSNNPSENTSNIQIETDNKTSPDINNSGIVSLNGNVNMHGNNVAGRDNVINYKS